MRRAVLSLGAVAVILLSSFCGMQIVSDSGCGEPIGGTAGPLSWTIENGFTLSVTGEGNMPNYGSTEPPWKQYHETITGIAVGEGVTRLGVSAFAGMDHVTTATLPESLTLIENNCFEDCTALESIVIPDGVTSPGRSTFRNCTSLQSAIIGDGATYIGQYTFSGCTALESVILGSSVNSVGDYCFQGCTSLSDVSFNEGMTSIGQYCFQGCTALEHVDLPSTLVEMKGYCFSGSGLTETSSPTPATRSGDTVSGTAPPLSASIIPRTSPTWVSDASRDVLLSNHSCSEAPRRRSGTMRSTDVRPSPTAGFPNPSSPSGTIPSRTARPCRT